MEILTVISHYLMKSSLALRTLLIDSLNDLYDAENQLLDALPKMAKAATGKNLQQGFLDHYEETKVHVSRLEKAFSFLAVNLNRKSSVAMRGLVEEGNEAIALEATVPVRDVALIGAARRVEHYELAAYKSLRGLAAAVNEESVADLLQQTMDEECEADKRLCSLADLALEAAKDFPATEQNNPVPNAPRKPGKKKQN